jgi:hypothetical protein
VGYLLELLGPLAFLPIACPALLIPAIPNFAANVLSSFGGTCNTGMRYVLPLIPFLFASAACGLGRILAGAPPERRRALERRWLGAALILTLLCSLTIDLSPFSLVRSIPRITAHQRIVLDCARRIPDNVPVATQAGIYQHVVRRKEARCGLCEGAEYILVDRTSPWFERAHWEEDLPGVIGSGAYRVLEDRDGVLLMKRKQAEK